MIQTQAHGKPLVNMSDEDDDLLNEEGSDEPLSLFSLEDKSFPFVCTYDQLLRLLDNTIQLSSPIPQSL